MWGKDFASHLIWSVQNGRDDVTIAVPDGRDGSWLQTVTTQSCTRRTVTTKWGRGMGVFRSEDSRWQRLEAVAAQVVAVLVFGSAVLLTLHLKHVGERGVQSERQLQ